MLVMFLVNLFLFVIILFAISVVIHLFKILFIDKRKFNQTCSSKRDRPAKTMIIMGSGGHTGEMIRLITGLDFDKFSPRLYVVANTDETSKSKVQALEDAWSSKHTTNTEYKIKCISRSREVHQPWGSTILTFTKATMECISIILSFRPDIIICNGPGTCVPPCLIAFLLKLLWFKNSTTVFVESICRVNSLSLTGKIMLHVLADRTIVQWPELHSKYPTTVYLGRLV